MITNLILVLGIIAVAGFFGGSLAHFIKFPRVTGYIIIGIVLSPSLTGVIAETAVSSLEIYTSIALGIIAYSIGGKLRLAEIKQMESSIAWITPVQAAGTWFLTALVVTFIAPFILELPEGGLLHSYFPVAFVLGAIASATAPATVLAIIREYKARGSLTTILLSIIAIDDGLAIILFSIAMGIATGLVGAAGGLSLYGMVGEPLLEIAGSVALGTAIGFGLIYAARLVKSRSLLLALILGAIFMCVGIAEQTGLSLILSNMVIGVIVCNLYDRQEMLDVVDGLEDIVFVIFFVLAGLHFSLEAMGTAGLIALLILVARFIAKYFGSMAGARIAGSPGKVRRYLGLALMPAAGVSLGLALLAQRAFPETGHIIYNSILAAVILNEILGPPLTKLAISRAGEQHAD